MEMFCIQITLATEGAFVKNAFTFFEKIRDKVHIVPEHESDTEYFLKIDSFLKNTNPYDDLDLYDEYFENWVWYIQNVIVSLGNKFYKIEVRAEPNETLQLVAYYPLEEM